jgi:hypothetical protein
LIIVGVFVLLANPATEQQPYLPLLILVFLLGLGVLGLLALPLRGRMLEVAYTERMLNLQKEYLENVNKAADKQIAYGMSVRRESVAPLTRLIEAQTTIQTDQLNQLQAAQQEMTAVEAELTAMGKSLFGLRG